MKFIIVVIICCWESDFAYTIIGGTKSSIWSWITWWYILLNQIEFLWVETWGKSWFWTVPTLVQQKYIINWVSPLLSISRIFTNNWIILTWIRKAAWLRIICNSIPFNFKVIPSTRTHSVQSWQTIRFIVWLSRSLSKITYFETLNIIFTAKELCDNIIIICKSCNRRESRIMSTLNVSIPL